MKRFASTLKRKGLTAYKILISAIPNPAYKDQKILMDCLASHGIVNFIDFDWERFKNKVLNFVMQMRISKFRYRFSPSIDKPTLYSSVYACLIMSLFDELRCISEKERMHWADYFDRFQTSSDGLFRDKSVLNSIYDNSDWWGARHLVPHIIAAYSALGRIPKHPFAYLQFYKSKQNVIEWLDKQNWDSEFTYANDIDNQIMNVVCALQYERDFRKDSAAAETVKVIQEYLAKKNNPEFGLWGNFNAENQFSLSRSVQFAYHLYPIFFYDGLNIGIPNKTIDLVLKTQNQLGGYGVEYNSSACEDIDSLYLLCQLTHRSNHRIKKVILSIKRALVWILSNQNSDGGFVFKRNEPLFYGHQLMSCAKNESAMFPTWFRTLAIAYGMSFIGIGNFHMIRCPGMQSEF